MVKLKSISIKNFKSFKDTSLEFPDSGLVSLEGKNLDTGGSSGAGKSNLNNAIAYALGYASAPASTMQSWHSEDPMQVILTLTTDQGDVVISRGHKNSIKIGSRTITGAKAIEDAIKTVIGLDADTLKALVYRPQKTAGLFLSMDDADKKDFLGKVLDLGKYENALEKIQENEKKIELDRVRSQSVYDALASTITVVEQPTLNELVLDTVRDEAADFRKKAGEIAERVAKGNHYVTTINSELSKKRDEINQKHGSFIKDIEQKIKEYWSNYSYTPDTTEIDTANAKIVAIKARIQTVIAENNAANRLYEEYQSKRTTAATLQNMLVKKVVSIDESIADLKGKLATVESGVCYACNQNLPDSSSKESIEKQIADLENDKIIVEEDRQRHLDFLTSDPVQPVNRDRENKLREALAAETNKVSMLENAAKQDAIKHKEAYALGVNDLNGQISTQKLLWASELAETNAKYESKIAQYKQKITELELEKQKLDHAAAQKDSEAKSMIDGFKLQKASYDTYIAQKDRVDSSKRDLDILVKNKQNCRAAVEMLKGFLGSIFEEILDEVSGEANDILRTIPNVSHCSIQFQTDLVTQKGTTKKRITPVVSVGGNTGPIKTTCSGGMESAIELAVDIAVANVIERRSGAAPKWMVLDEAFDGFDSVVKESCLEMLQKHADDKLIIVVTHSNDFKEFFANSFEVSYQNGESRIVS